jgi:hypothetical protein
MAKVDLEALKREAMSISEADARPKWPNEELRSLSIKRRNEAEPDSRRNAREGGCQRRGASRENIKE